MTHVQKTRTCWLWIGRVESNGYGRKSFRCINENWVHRVSWRFFKGLIPRNLFVLHKCDVRNYIRPSHLFLGTQKDNILDAVRKGRFIHPSGRNHWNYKLTTSKILQIQKQYIRGYRGYPGNAKVLAIKFGLNFNTICLVANHKGIYS